jgi:hypothetical protein
MDTVYSTTVDTVPITTYRRFQQLLNSRREVTPMTVTAIQIGLDPDDIRRWYPNPEAVA